MNALSIFRLDFNGFYTEQLESLSAERSMIEAGSQDTTPKVSAAKSQQQNSTIKRSENTSTKWLQSHYRKQDSRRNRTLPQSGCSHTIEIGTSQKTMLPQRSYSHIEIGLCQRNRTLPQSGCSHTDMGLIGTEHFHRVAAVMQQKQDFTIETEHYFEVLFKWILYYKLL